MIKTVLLLILGMALYPWLVHQTLTGALEQRGLYSLASTALLVFIVLLISIKSRYRIITVGICFLFSAYIYHHQALLIKHIAWLYLFEYSTFNAIMCFGFAKTLVAGRTPLVTHFASLLRNSMSPAIVAYTRKVTWAWVTFFATLIIVSFILFLFSSQPMWSLFTTILTPILVFAMFACEYAVRLRMLPHEQHSGLLYLLRLFRIRST